jgi:rsbT co-antagonist protein RsbR
MPKIPDVLKTYESDLIADWMKEQLAAGYRADLISEAELRQECRRFVELFRKGMQSGEIEDLSGPRWDDMRELLSNLSRSRAMQGFTASETATFILSFKQPLFSRLQRDVKDAKQLAKGIWSSTRVLDKLALYTMEFYQKSREEIIQRQQAEMMELSTPVVKLWEGVLALPMIGTLDSNRTQVVMETLLQRIVDTGSEVAIIDITGVPTVDTLTAQHLLKTVTAARLMGADCIISGIRPQIAQTIVHLGVNLGDVITKATLADALSLSLRRMGLAVKKLNGEEKKAVAKPAASQEAEQ